MLAPGTVLQSRYVVERPVGEGGMGAVYVATDRRFDSTVALKETLFDDPALRRASDRRRARLICQRILDEQRRQRTEEPRRRDLAPPAPTPPR